MAPHGHTAAHGLGQADDVGLHTEETGGAARADGETGLHLVEGQQHVVAACQLAHALQVARQRRDDAGVHHQRFHDHPRDAPFVLGEHLLEDGQVVERDHTREVHHRLRYPAAGWHRPRTLGRAELVHVAVHRDHDGVVMAVVAALDLDDEVPAGDGAHQVDGVHGGLGAGVAEAPPGQTEPAAQLLGHDHRVLGGLGEVGSQTDPAFDGLDDGRVGVTDEHGAVTGVEIDVLHAVEVVDLRTPAVADPHRCGTGDHPARRGPPGQ